MSYLGTCAHCGEPKTPRTMPSGKVEVDSRVIRRRFCSEQCRSNSASFPLRPCDECGQTIPRRVYPSAGRPESAATYSKRRFCSRKCQGQSRADECGTPAGPNRHRMRGEEPCEVCHIAARDARRTQALVDRGINPGSVTHGTFSGGMVDCKCRECLPWRTVQHGNPQSYDDGCRCETCTNAKVALVDKWREESPAAFAAAMERWKLSARERNDRSRDQAHHWYYQWTGPELEIAARTDLTSSEVAYMIGRTVAGVQRARYNMRRDVEAVYRGGFVSS